MKKTIYNTYVIMGNQAECDQMKEICLHHKLPIWKDDSAFEFWEDSINVLMYSVTKFSIGCFSESDLSELPEIKVSRLEWSRLLKKIK